MLDLYSDHIEGGNSVVKDVANVYDVHIIATGAVISLSRSITLVLTIALKSLESSSTRQAIAWIRQTNSACTNRALDLEILGHCRPPFRATVEGGGARLI